MQLINNLISSERKNQLIADQALRIGNPITSVGDLYFDRYNINIKNLNIDEKLAFIMSIISGLVIDNEFIDKLTDKKNITASGLHFVVERSSEVSDQFDIKIVDSNSHTENSDTRIDISDDDINTLLSYILDCIGDLNNRLIMKYIKK